MNTETTSEAIPTIPIGMRVRWVPMARDKQTPLEALGRRCGWAGDGKATIVGFDANDPPLFRIKLDYRGLEHWAPNEELFPLEEAEVES